MKDKKPSAKVKKFRRGTGGQAPSGVSRNDAMMQRVEGYMERQTIAYERIAKALEPEPETKEDVARQKFVRKANRLAAELLEKAGPLVERLLSSGGDLGSVDLAEVRAASARQRVINEKRRALAQKLWDETDKARHGPECEFDACVCLLHFQIRAVPFPFAGIHRPGAATVAAFGTPVAQQSDSGEAEDTEYEVTS